MSFGSARSHFTKAKNASDDPAIQELAKGLDELARAISSQLDDIERQARMAANK